jgi:hypothetical protein
VKDPDAGRGGRVTVARRITHVDRTGEIQIPGRG